MPLSALPHAILVQITDLLRCTSPDTLDHLSLVNSLFRSLAKYSQHAHVTLKLSAGDEGSLARKTAWIQSTDLLSAVREITITDSKTSGDEEHSSVKCIDIVCRFLSSLPGLRVVNYIGTKIPTRVVAALQSTPHVKLRIPSSDPFNIQPEQIACLHGSHNLHTLGVKFTWVDTKECLQIMRLLKRVLLSCPNLRCLSLDISQPKTGCVIFGPTQEYVGLGFEDGEKPPPLEELVLIGYPFGHERRIFGDALALELNAVGYPGKGLEVDYWVDNFDWSRLRRLETADSNFSLKAAAKLEALKDVVHLNAWAKEDIAAFYHQVASSLNAISVPSLNHIGMTGILRHAETLQVLHIHQPESYGLRWDEGAMDLDSLQQIQHECPLVRDLVIDLVRDETWPYTAFDMLAAFPKLYTLEIWFAIGVEDPEHPRTPFVTLDAAKHIYHYVLSQRSVKFSPLKKLTLHSGAPPPMGIGYPSPGAFWPEHNSTLFICELSERDDEAPLGHFSVTCPKLAAYSKRGDRDGGSKSKAEKRHATGLRALRNLRRSFTRAPKTRGPDMEQHQKNLFEQARLVAFEGPRPMSQWKSIY